jgi:hypothetical protein
VRYTENILNIVYMSVFTNTIIITIMLVASVYGLTLHKGLDYFPKANNQIFNTPAVFGLLIMLNGMYGSPALVEKPSIFKDIASNKIAKAFILYLISYAAARDFEDAIFLLILFLAVTQLFRTKEERQKHPYIL